MADTEITEFIEIDPDELHLVGKGANGFKALLAKSASEEVREVLETIATVTDTEIEKADDDSGKCKTCKGDGKIMAGHRKCPDCGGSGVQPKVGESAKAFAERAAKANGVAPSGAPVPVRDDCPTCKGGGTIHDGSSDGKECVDCGGTGHDQSTTNASELHAVDGDAGSVTEGDSKNRETVDKATGDPCTCCDKCTSDMGDDKGCGCCDDCGDMEDDDATKATVSTADQNDLPDSAFAFIEKGGTKDADGKTTPRSLRHFPIMDESHVRNALARASQSPFGTEAMPAIRAAAEKFGIKVSDAAKADGSMFSGTNPNAAMVATADDGSSVPGSPAWESVDAATATAAATALMSAAELIRKFAQREAQEVVAGEGNDVFDTFAAQDALCSVSDAIGIMAQMAFHESLSAQKSLTGTPEAVEKAGKRLSTKSVSALAAARDKAKELSTHLTGLLGDDDPSKKDKSDKKSGGKSAADKFVESANKALLMKEVDEMTAEELMRLLDERDALKAAAEATNKDDATKGETADAVTEDATVADDTTEKATADTNAETAVVADDTETDASTTDAPAKAEKAELTEEEIEAREARKAAKKQLKLARKAEKAAADNAAVTKALEESKAEAVRAVTALEERLASVEKMAAPSTIVRTRPLDAIAKSAERDALDVQIAQHERIARDTPDQDIRKASREHVVELRAKLAEL